MDNEGNATSEKQEATEEQKLQEQLLRLHADFQNYRKRTSRQIQRMADHASEEVIKRLLPLADDFDRALENLKSDDGPARKGFEMVSDKFSSFLESEGVERVGAPGEGFDPKIHEAVSVQEDDDLQEGMVQEVLQSGYRMGDSILRPAKVKVTVKKAG